LVTSAAALELLGSDFVYTTVVYARGEQAGTVLKGDICIMGGGDPSLGSAFVKPVGKSFEDQLVEVLRKDGVSTITGDLIVDVSYFESVQFPSGRLWDDMGNYFGALPFGLSYRDNSFDLFLKSPAEAGKLCSVVECNPLLQGVQFECRVKSSDSKTDSAYIYGVPGMNRWVIQGTIPKGQERFRIRGAHPNPAVYLGLVLKQKLNENGISLQGDVIFKTDAFRPGLKMLMIYRSPSLAELVEVVNSRSNNLYADHLFLTVGKHLHKTTDWILASRGLENYWNEKLGAGTFNNLSDGSGLSLFNSVSAISISRLLQYMHQSKHFGAYKKSLAIGGVSGTVKNMWTDLPSKGRVFAKSGSMSGVMAYAGYIYPSSGGEYSFAIIVNRFESSPGEARKFIEEFVSKLIVSL
jgi:D-alanyl-D-alanine carboxypeptidase/D-alanyl-D-alanine-endopeptidase (penicillin-binding protein 4)